MSAPISSAALLLAWLISPGGAAQAAALDAAQVTIENFAFTPSQLTVKPGTEVTFVNHDDIPHSIVASKGEFHSSALDTDERFVFRFTTPGEFIYFCGLHPHMTAKIEVVP
jgi:plastocyanin